MRTTIPSFEALPGEASTLPRHDRLGHVGSLQMKCRILIADDHEIVAGVSVRFLPACDQTGKSVVKQEAARRPSRPLRD
jgi:hypothetical protein